MGGIFYVTEINKAFSLEYNCSGRNVSWDYGFNSCSRSNDFYLATAGSETDMRSAAMAKVFAPMVELC